MKYRAFISYSQKDKAFATWLHKKLENSSLPKEANLNTSDRKLRPIFRDRDEMSASADLGGALKNALDDSEALVVVLSSNSVQSKWVNEEISYFSENHPDRAIFFIHSDQHKDSGADPKQFVALSNSTQEHLYADARKSGDGRHKAALKVISSLVGVSFDSLYKREQRRKSFRVASGVCLAIIASAIGIFSFQQVEIQKEKALIAENEAKAERLRANQEEIIAKVSNGLQPVHDRIVGGELEQGFDDLQGVHLIPILFTDRMTNAHALVHSILMHDPLIARLKFRLKEPKNYQERNAQAQMRMHGFRNTVHFREEGAIATTVDGLNYLNLKERRPGTINKLRLGPVYNKSNGFLRMDAFGEPVLVLTRNGFSILEEGQNTGLVEFPWNTGGVPQNFAVDRQNNRILMVKDNELWISTLNIGKSGQLIAELQDGTQSTVFNIAKRNAFLIVLKQSEIQRSEILQITFDSAGTPKTTSLMSSTNGLYSSDDFLKTGCLDDGVCYVVGKNHLRFLDFSKPATDVVTSVAHPGKINLRYPGVLDKLGDDHYFFNGKYEADGRSYDGYVTNRDGNVYGVDITNSYTGHNEGFISPYATAFIYDNLYTVIRLPFVEWTNAESISLTELRSYGGFLKKGPSRLYRSPASNGIFAVSDATGETLILETLWGRKGIMVHSSSIVPANFKEGVELKSGNFNIPQYLEDESRVEASAAWFGQCGYGPDGKIHIVSAKYPAGSQDDNDRVVIEAQLSRLNSGFKVEKIYTDQAPAPKVSYAKSYTRRSEEVLNHFGKYSISIETDFDTGSLNVYYEGSGVPIFELGSVGADVITCAAIDPDLNKLLIGTGFHLIELNLPKGGPKDWLHELMDDRIDNYSSPIWLK